VNTTRALVSAIARAKGKPKFLISGSAVGYYGPRGDEPLTENSPAGAGFLAEVCREWEDEARQAQGHGVRVALLRTGIVLGKGEGALAKMVKPFKLFAGGYPRVRQAMDAVDSCGGRGWVDPVLDGERKCRRRLQCHGAESCNNGGICRALASALNRPSWAPVPASVLTLLRARWPRCF
jgi:NAD dependent epimerase/dehydratase family enzyme